MKTSSRRFDPGGREGRGRIARRTVALAALLAVLASAGSGFSEEKGAVPPRGGGGAGGGRVLEPGATAPGFTVKDIGGDVFDFEAEKAKSPFLVVFFSIFCEPCRREMSVAQRLHDRFRDAGWRVVGVSLDGLPLKNAVAGFIRQEGYSFPVLVDELDARGVFRAADLFGVSEMPSTFVIEKGGRIAFGRKGPVTEEELEKFMQPARKP